MAVLYLCLIVLKNNLYFLFYSYHSVQEVIKVISIIIYSICYHHNIIHYYYPTDDDSDSDRHFLLNQLTQHDDTMYDDY